MGIEPMREIISRVCGVSGLSDSSVRLMQDAYNAATCMEPNIGSAVCAEKWTARRAQSSFENWLSNNKNMCPPRSPVTVSIGEWKGDRVTGSRVPPNHYKTALYVALGITAVTAAVVFAPEIAAGAAAVGAFVTAKGAATVAATATGMALLGAAAYFGLSSSNPIAA